MNGSQANAEESKRAEIGVGKFQGQEPLLAALGNQNYAENLDGSELQRNLKNSKKN